MGASVRIEDTAFADQRVEHLASLIGTDKFGALGRLAYLWRQCTDEQTFCLPESFVRVLIDPEKLIEARLAERVDGGIYIKGTRGRIEWLGKLRKNGRKGGRPRKTKPKPNGYPNGGASANPPIPVPTPTPIDLDHDRRVDPVPPSHAVSLRSFSDQIGKAGIRVVLGLSEQTRYSKLHPVDQREIDHALDRAKSSGIKKPGYVLGVIEGERQRAAEVKDQPPSAQQKRVGPPDWLMKIAHEEVAKKKSKQEATNAAGK